MVEELVEHLTVIEGSIQASAEKQRWNYEIYYNLTNLNFTTI